MNGRSTEYPAYNAGARPANPKDGESIKFTSKERDSETGLDYFGARYFSSVQGRWTSADAPFADQHAQNPQSWNLYGYVTNNPLRLIDPNGRQSTSPSAGVDALYASGKITYEEWQRASHAANVGAVAGMTAGVAAVVSFFSPELGAALYHWARTNPQQVQEIAAGVAEDVSGAPPGALSTFSGIGSFAHVSESMSARSAAYQSKIAGTLPDVNYWAVPE